MHDREIIFIRAAESAREVAEVLVGMLGLESMHYPWRSGPDNDIGLRGCARTAEGYLGFRIHPNVHAQPNPAPDEIQATVGYEIQVAIWYGRGKSEPEIQQREAWVVFDQLIYKRPKVGMLLCHDVDLLVAAYLPGAGVHTFPLGTTVDATDAGLWRPWLAPPPAGEPDLDSRLDPAVVRQASEVLSRWVGVNMPGMIGPDTLPDDFARWNICPCDDWLLFTPPSGYAVPSHQMDGWVQFPGPRWGGSEAFLVCGDTVYFFWTVEQSLKAALRSARGLRACQPPRWRRWLSERRSR